MFYIYAHDPLKSLYKVWDLDQVSFLFIDSLIDWLPMDVQFLQHHLLKDYPFLQ